MLITFNILTYDKIIQFEQTLVTQIRAQNTSQRQNSVQRFREGSQSTISEYFLFYFSDHSSICHVNNLQYLDVRQDYSVWANFSDSNQSSEYVTEAKFGPKISWRLSIYYIWVPPQRTWERFQRCITQFCTESQHSGEILNLVIWQIENKCDNHVQHWWFDLSCNSSSWKLRERVVYSCKISL